MDTSSHVGIADKKAADGPAKEGASLSQFHTPTSFREAETLLKYKSRHWVVRVEGGWDNYNPHYDQINMLDWRSQLNLHLPSIHWTLGSRNTPVDWTLLNQPTENLTERSRVQSTFCKHTHFYRERAKPFGRLTLIRTSGCRGLLDDLGRTAVFMAATELWI